MGPSGGIHTTSKQAVWQPAQSSSCPLPSLSGPCSRAPKTSEAFRFNTSPSCNSHVQGSAVRLTSVERLEGVYTLAQANCGPPRCGPGACQHGGRPHWPQKVKSTTTSVWPRHRTLLHEHHHQAVAGQIHHSARLGLNHNKLRAWQCFSTKMLLFVTQHRRVY